MNNPIKTEDKNAEDDTRISLPLEAFKSFLPYLVAILLTVVCGYWFIDPAPPKKIVISISKSHGEYVAFASLYEVLLKQEGIALEIRESDSQTESLNALRKQDSGVDLTFIQGGVVSAESSIGVVSLGSLYYEPIWVFSNHKRRIAHLSELKGSRISIGRAGSGGNIILKSLLNAAGITAQNSTLIEIDEDEAEEALKHGTLNTMIVAAVPTSPLVHRLANLPDIAIANFNDADAYTRQFTYLHNLILPEGSLNLTTNIPNHDLHLLAPTVTLIARDSMHPALIYLVLKIISRVHGSAGLLQHEHEFPADKDTDFELSHQAKKFYESGVPFFDRYLPFWAANFAERVLIILIPIVALLIPISRIIPSVYTWLNKSRVHKLYGELRFLELQLLNSSQPVELAVFRKELDSIENRVNHLHLPAAFASHLYELRSHIELVRSKIS